MRLFGFLNFRGLFTAYRCHSGNHSGNAGRIGCVEGSSARFNKSRYQRMASRTTDQATLEGIIGIDRTDESPEGGAPPRAAAVRRFGCRLWARVLLEFYRLAPVVRYLGPAHSPYPARCVGPRSVGCLAR